MQIIADIPNNHYKITVFKNGMKYSIQLEGKLLQMIYRLPEMDAFDSNAKVLKAISDDLLKHALDAMYREEKSMAALLNGYENEEFFEEII